MPIPEYQKEREMVEEENYEIRTLRRRVFELENTRSMQITDLIGMLNDTFGRYPNETGGCLKFGLLVWMMYGTSVELMYDGDHVVIRLGDKCFDIDGEVPEEAARTFVNELHESGLGCIEGQFGHLLSPEYLSILSLYFETLDRKSKESLTN